MSEFDYFFHHPTTIQISGPTGCGKTRFVLRILQERLIHPFPERIIWVYAEWQPDYDTLKELYPHIEFVQGFSEELYDSIKPTERNLLVLDD
jgi:Ni2+-binding GTPase involved in maturation of urease and hydrogenase